MRMQSHQQQMTIKMKRSVRIYIQSIIKFYYFSLLQFRCDNQINLEFMNKWKICLTIICRLRFEHFVLFSFFLFCSFAWTLWTIKFNSFNDDSWPNKKVNSGDKIQWNILEDVTEVVIFVTGSQYMVVSLFMCLWNSFSFKIWLLAE